MTPSHPDFNDRWASLQVQEQTSVTAGGLMLPDTARERPMSGQIIRTGPGKRDKDGSRKPPKVGC